MGPDAMIFVFWMLSFKPTLSLSSFTFIKRLYSSSSLSAVRVVSPAYLRLLIFLLAILFLACASSSPAFLMTYSAYKLNNQSDNIQPWQYPSSRGSYQHRDQTWVSCVAGGFFTIWATRKAQEYWSGYPVPSPGDFPDPGIEPGSPTL